MKSAQPRHIHIIGACGRALGPLALDLQRRGWSISASDAVRYAPMDRFLEEAGLSLKTKFSARNLPAETSLVVRGTGVDVANVEVRAALKRGIPVCNMAQFIGQFLANQAKRVVVAGTKGKTTTTAMLAWILEHARKRPDYLIGGLCPLFPLPVRMRGSRWVVLEGDEYPSAKDDPTPKFHYYHPHALVVTSLQLDHPDVYRSLAEVKAEFVCLTKHLPPDGRLIINGQCPNARALRAFSPALVESVGWSRTADFALSKPEIGPWGTRFTFCGQSFFLPIAGRVFALDAAMAARAALLAGVSLKASAVALAKFQGVLGRMQSVLSDPRMDLVLDEAYHPLAVAENLKALRQLHPERRLVVIIQPRHTGGRQGFQSRDLPQALASADLVLLMRPFDIMQFPGGAFSNRALATELRQHGVKVAIKPSSTTFMEFCPRRLRSGDVVYCSLQPGCDFLVSPLAATLQKTFLT